MADPKTILLLPGTKLSVNRLVKRGAQALAGTAIGAVAIGFVMILNGLLSGHGSALQWLRVWLTFIERPEIIVTMLLAAFSTAVFIAWQRDRERGR